MDFIAHFLWSFIIFSGPQLYLALFFGVFPDLIPFGLNIAVSIFHPKRGVRDFRNMQNMMAYYEQPENRWVYSLYNWTHSLVMCGLSFLVLWIIGLFFNFFPWFIVAWLLHILIDIPTHKRAFFAPQFLTPLSHFNVDGISWVPNGLCF